MLGNTIVLPVDVANNATIVDYSYRRYDEFQNRSVYNGDNHSLVSPDTLTFYRSPVKKSGNYLGVAKSAAKITKTVSVLGADGTSISAPCIAEVSFSFPVGVTPAQQREIRQRLVALLDLETVIAPLNETLDI